jgi:PAS domain S-box-containing protein
MMAAPIPFNEKQRLTELLDFEILDTLPDPDLDSLVALASSILDVPICLISLVDHDRQWFKAKLGLEACETDRQSAFCAHAILEDEPLLVENALEDPRFANNPLVLGPPNIRSYFGFPLVVGPELRLGTLCAIDVRPRTITDQQITQMKALAKLVVNQMKMMRSARDTIMLAATNENLYREADRARVVLETMSEGVLIKNRAGQVIQANPSASKILGISHDALLGLKLDDPSWVRLHEDGTRYLPKETPASEVLRTGKAISNRVVGIYDPNGQVKWLHLSASPLFEPFEVKPSFVISTFSDVTHLKAQQATLTHLIEAANAANSAKTQFLANMSHELRTPLNGVVGVASALINTPLDARQTRMVELIRSSGKDLERLLSDILDLTKVEVGELELEQVDVDIGSLVQEVASLMSPACQEKGLELVVENDLMQGQTYQADPGRLRQILTNLVSNAVKFTSVGKITISLRQNADNSGILIGVQDTGIGFDSAQAKRIFERFSQADTSITRRFGGTGLGLAISKSLTELMGGVISATSTPQVGSLFTLDIPMVPSSKPLEHMPLVGTCGLSEGIPKHMKVLLVEDQILNQSVFGFMMEPFEADFFTALDGAQGVEAFESGKFDVIFMDMQMPVMDGLTATAEIRKLERASGVKPTPIIMLTANAGEVHRRAALAAGADLHVSKPVTQKAIADALRLVLCGQASAQTLVGRQN